MGQLKALATEGAICAVCSASLVPTGALQTCSAECAAEFERQEAQS